MIKTFVVAILSLVLLSSCSSLGERVNSFEECIEAGYPVMESYPRQCRGPTGETFVEKIDEVVETENI